MSLFRQQNANCPFCTKPANEIVFSNLFAKAFFDQTPSNPGHMLVVPRAHVQTVFDLHWWQLLAVFSLVRRCKRFLDRNYAPGGYQMMINSYPVGGQSVPHFHIHVIPRYRGQTDREQMPRDKSWKFAKRPAVERPHNPGVPGDGNSVWRAWTQMERKHRSLNYADVKYTDENPDDPVK